MKIAFITPTAYLSRYATASDIHLILPHLVNERGDSRYAEFYRKRLAAGDWVILDNGMFELGEPFMPEVLCDMACALGVSEVVAPDYRDDGPETVAGVAKFLRVVPSPRPFKVGVVAQGADFQDFLYCYLTLQRFHPDIIYLPWRVEHLEIPLRGRTHALSMTSSRMFNRIALVEYLHHSGLMHPLPHHLLGMADGAELIHYGKSPELQNLRSVDSSSAFVHGLNGIRYTHRGLPCEKIEKRLDFHMGRLLSPAQEADIAWNITALLSFANGTRIGETS